MDIDQAKVEEFVAALKTELQLGFDRPVDVNAHQGKKWYTPSQYRQMADGNHSISYAFPPMSYITSDLKRNKQFSHSKPGAEELQEMAVNAGLKCDIISCDTGLVDARTQSNHGTWNLSLHGRETLEALAAAGLGSAAKGLAGALRQGA